MDILEALRINRPTANNKEFVSDAVFNATLYRLGREDHMDCPVEEREELLSYLQSIK